MTTAWIWLGLSIIGSSGGNVLMKYASQEGPASLAVFFSAPFISGGMLFAAGLYCYMRALHTLPLAVAYPTVVGTSIVAISAMAIMFFGERITVTHVIGVILIFAGLVLLTRGGATAA